MAVYRCDFRFAEFKQGWTETFYLINSISINAAAAVVENTMINLMMPPRSENVSSAGIKVTQVDPPAPRLTLRKPAPSSGGRPALLGEGADIVQTAVFADVIADNGVRRNWLIRGLEDRDTLRQPATGLFTPTPQLTAGLDSLYAGLISAGFQVRNKVTSTAEVGLASTQVDPANASQQQFTTATPNPFVVDNVVYFKKVTLRDMPWLKGSWIVRATDANHFSISYAYPLNGPLALTRTSAKLIVYQYNPILSITTEGVTKRDTGRGLVPSRGKSRGIRFRV